MIIYWTNMIVPFLFLLMSFLVQRKIMNIFLVLYLFYLVLFVGFRYEIGGDWKWYLLYFEDTSKFTIFDFIITHNNYELFYVLVNYFANISNLGIYGVNFICALIFFVGFYLFLKDKDHPFLIILIATPYLINIVLMGYSRQGVAVGLILWATTYWNDKILFRYVLLIISAGFFHSTAFIFLIFIFLKIRSLISLLISLVIVSIPAYFLYNKIFEYYVYWYLIGKGLYHSTGGFLRSTINFIPGFFYIIYYKYFSQYKDHILWLAISFIAIMLPFLTLYSSTAIDRIGIYFSIIQLIFFSRIITLIQQNNFKLVSLILISTLYVAVNYFWLNFAYHVSFWVPYNNVLFLGQGSETIHRLNIYEVE